MAQITLIFQQNSINISAQIGDTAYYVDPTSTGGFDVGDNIIEIGEILTINKVANQTIITCTVNPAIVMPVNNISYIFFSKTNKTNLASLVGYYGLAKFRNNSTVKAEIFATACEVFESSK